MSDAWERLTAHLTEFETLRAVQGVLAWDQQTHMPPAGGASRGAQLALVSRLAHERFTAPEVGAWLDTLEGQDLPALQRAATREIRRAWRTAVRIPGDLVERLAIAETQGFEAWIQAKQSEDFSKFAPALARNLELTREKARAIDADRPVYDVLLDEFDPGTTTADLTSLFTRLRAGLVELIGAIDDRPGPARVTAPFPLAAQQALHEQVAARLGYDLAAGRIDAAEHPFSIGIAPGDVRITTHLYENDLLKGLKGTIHETGHALYEQGLPTSLVGTGLREAASYGLHESQSRFWENFIGGSEPFFRWLEGPLRERFPDAPDALALYGASNRVSRGLVRIAADEVTYNLHIIVRFELEVALLNGDLAVADLPAAWNERYAALLGVTPDQPSRGVLQDVHWSGASFGYFPSYTLGNLYAASMGAVLPSAIPGLWDDVARGEFGRILAWLRQNVHQHAHTDDAPAIVRRAVGDRDPVADLLDHLWGRHGALYGVSRR